MWYVNVEKGLHDSEIRVGFMINQNSMVFVLVSFGPDF